MKTHLRKNRTTAWALILIVFMHLRGNCLGSLAFSKLTVTIPAGAQEAMAIDFNSDGSLDLVITGLAWPPTYPPTYVPIAALKNLGHGLFVNATAAVLGSAQTVHARDLRTGDFDGDGRMDLFIADHGTDMPPFPGGQSLLLSQTVDGHLRNDTTNRLAQVLAFTHHATIGDVDGDLDPDIYMANIWNSAQVGPRIYINNGSGAFTPNSSLPPSILSLQDRYTAALFVDVDGDGDLDLVLGGHNGTEDHDRLLLNDGHGNFTYAPLEALPLRHGGTNWDTIDIAVGDVDGDGWPDLFMVQEMNFYQQPFIQLLLNNHDGTFRDASTNIVQSWPAPASDNWIPYVRVVDLDGDGDLDFVCTLKFGRPQIFLNDGTGRFTAANQFLPTGLPDTAAIIPGDFDGDGNPDLFVLGYNQAVLLRNFALPKTNSYSSSKINQAIVFPRIGKRDVTNGPVSLNATASSGLPVSYEVLSGPAAVSGNTLDFAASGSVNIRASQPGNGTYNPAVPVEQLIIVTAQPVPKTITVTNIADSGAGTLRAALASAANGDTINFSLPSPAKITLTSGELLVTKSVNILGPGANNLAVDGNDTDRVFHITPSNNVTIASVTITNGSRARGSSIAKSSGGGILNEHAMLTVSNCTLRGNSATDFGSLGGAIFNDGDSGGSATLMLVNCTVSGNSAYTAGGVFNWGAGGGSATLMVVNCTFNGNSPSGIHNFGQSGGSAGLQVVNSTVSGNSSGFGIMNDAYSGRADVEMVNSTISGNSSFGLLNQTQDSASTGTVHILQCTLIGNSSYQIYNAGAAFSTLDVAIVSTIISGVPGSQVIYNNRGTVTSLGFNLSSDDGGGFLTNATDLINTDPLLGPLQDNGGPTFTHAFTCRSPAIDAGKNFSALNADQRGFARPFDDPAMPNAVGGDGTDIGAFEAQQPLLTCNLPPVADASATIPLVISRNGLDATAILDGSRSSDPDGDSLQYSWSESGTPLASGVVAVTILPVGTHSIQLTVSDGRLANTNSVNVEVITAGEAVNRLADTLGSSVPRPQSLLAALRAAIASADRNNPIPAINQLLAFQNQVRAQVEPLDPSLAASLIQSAQKVVDALSGGNTNPGGRPHGRFTSVTRQANGRLRMEFSAEAGAIHIIEASTNLVTWEMIGIAKPMADGSFEFEDTQARKFSSRYYRIVHP